MPRFTPRVLAVAWVLCACLCASAAAETAVGLAARGVDPMTALRSAGSLDLRDELGRPISAALIESELRSARAQASADASFSSRLPKARAMALALALWEGIKTGLSLPVPAAPRGEACALPSVRPGVKAAAALPPVPLAGAGESALSSSCRPLLPRAATGAPLVLRC